MPVPLCVLPYMPLPLCVRPYMPAPLCVRPYMPVPLCVCPYMPVPLCVRPYMPVPLCVLPYMPVPLCVCPYMPVPLCVRPYMHVPLCVRPNMHVCVCACVRGPPLPPGPSCLLLHEGLRMVARAVISRPLTGGEKLDMYGPPPGVTPRPTPRGPLVGRAASVGRQPPLWACTRCCVGGGGGGRTRGVGVGEGGGGVDKVLSRGRGAIHEVLLV